MYYLICMHTPLRSYFPTGWSYGAAELASTLLAGPSFSVPLPRRIRDVSPWAKISLWGTGEFRRELNSGGVGQPLLHRCVFVSQELFHRERSANWRIVFKQTEPILQQFRPPSSKRANLLPFFWYASVNARNDPTALLFSSDEKFQTIALRFNFDTRYSLENIVL